MAEPLDYFFQGANLGMRAGQARIQQEQFRTNLAERARQFNAELGLQQQKLKLDQKAQRINIKQDKLQLEKIERELQEDEDWSDYVSDFGERLMAMGPLDDLPRLNPAAPRRINDMLLESAIDWNTQQQKSMRGIMAKERLLSKEKQYNDDVAWAKENAPELLERLKLDPSRFDIDAEALRQARIASVEQKKADDALLRDIKIASATKVKPNETREQWMRRTYEDFIIDAPAIDAEGNPNLSGDKVYSPKLHRQVADELFGKVQSTPTDPPTPKEPEEPTLPDLDEDFINSTADKYGNQGEKNRIQEIQRSRMQP